MPNKAQTAIEKQEQTPRKKRALRVWLGLLTSSQLIEKQVRARFRTEFDTTLPRFDVMAALAREPKGQTMGDISRWLLVSSGNVTGIVSRLVADGLVTRTRSADDRRTHLVRLSRKGQAEFERLASTHEQWIKELLCGITRQEMATLDELLRKVKVCLANKDY
ncbi:MAG: MarR family transcriptional regulator [Xanthomonadales bacterium]